MTNSVMEEIYRVLKSSGRVVLNDMFLEREPMDENEKSLLKDIKKGLCLPSMLTKYFEGRRIRSNLERNWLYCYLFCKSYQNILPSSKRMSEHDQMRILQGNPGSEILKISRKAPIACNQAIESGLIGYLPKEENRETKVLKTLGKLIN
ncbi:MAG: hypothetical protein KatS3mg083_582 [Candidatus Dojkabacteria bacterium]|nr:MAG: hypothetical protein KatS3mg083_582 [Candidatus Dojkabacteria bacterium]